MNQLRPHLADAGWSFEDRKPIDMFGISMERALTSKSGVASAVGFGGGYFHLVKIFGLTRPLTAEEIVQFNAETQLFNLTPHDEPPTGILKAHVSARYGVDPQTLISLLTLSEDALAKLVSVIGANTLRAI
ncbi:hypothetical protein [Burkholderia sp. Bp9143]|uniref:hypothetical protein n=1 Tax=Burkholderia sp. Bp9143 TaxID=2184574 RepID=UPI000F5904C9|nr:hypothetical protein [Burkholderia sp. Bp9143]